MSSVYSILKKIKKLVLHQPIIVNENICNIENLLKDKRALVVGGTSGIGESTAIKLKQSGANVTVVGRHKVEIEGINSYVWDVSDFPNLEKNFNDIIKVIGKLDIVVLAQGILPDSNFGGDFLKISEKDFDDVMSVNLKSVFLLSQLIIDYYIKNKIAGHICIINSTEGLGGRVMPYGISKAATVSLTRGLGRSYARNGIIINGVAPGATATSMMRIKNDDLSYGIPSGRMSKPEEVANMVVYLCSDMGNQMPGSVVTVDGGEALH